MLDALAELARADADSEFREPIDWAALWATAKPILIVGGSLLLIVLMVGHYLVKIVLESYGPFGPRVLIMPGITDLSP